MTRVLIFNFFGGVMDRGIPLYTGDIAECMRRIGCEPLELRCPRGLQRAPRLLRNILFVIFEQLVAPATRVWRGCSVTVYPYNSVGVLDAMLGRSILVIHDLISNSQRSGALAARYVRLTQLVQRTLKRPVCAASKHTFVQLRRLSAFRRCPLHLWSNPFYLFEQALARHVEAEPDRCERRLDVLLCSGMGPNKDYSGALRLFRRSRALQGARLRILGFGDDAHLATRRVARLPRELRERIVVLPRLSLAEVVSEYLSSDLVWVHSRKEGFGRSVIEARLSGRPVIASAIPAFSRLRGPGVYLYRDAMLDAAITAALESRDPPSCLAIVEYHSGLELSVRAVVDGSAAASDPLSARA